MKMKKLAVGVMVLALAGSAMKVIGDDATTKPSDAAPKHEHTRGGGIPRPFNQLTDLTDDQKAQITKIHQKELDDAKKLVEQENTDITALLTDDQKKELDDLAAKAKADAKAANEARKAKLAQEKADELKQKTDGTPTTAPSNDAAK